jgi:uncharacterized protein YdeI (BOF family)
MRKLAILAFFALCVVPAVAAAGLPFIQDKFGAAQTEAKQKKLPIFVECWAPW